MKIAIFGGTFDPFTKAHEAIVNKVLDEKIADEVIIAPTVTNWYRDKSDTWLSDRERLDLCYLASDWINNCREKQAYRPGRNSSVWWRDIQRKAAFPEGEMRDNFVKSWHFIDTLVDIMTERANWIDECEGDANEYYVVIGSDQLEFFKNWYRWEDILKLASLVVVNNRNGKKVESDISHIDIEIDSPLQNVSATEMRKQWREKENGLEEYCKLFREPPKEELLHHTPIFDLVSKPDPDGTIGFNPVGINSPDWCAIAAKLNGKWVTVTQLRYGLMKKFTEFPCGMVEKGEDPLDAAIRELAEETGIVINDKSHVISLGKYAANPAFMSNYMHYFYVDLDNANWRQAEQKLDEHEKLKIGWLDVSETCIIIEDASALMAGMVLKLKEKGLL